MHDRPQINFRKTRDFSNKINATFEFIRQNVKLLLKCLAYIAGPFILMLGVVSAYFQQFAFNPLEMIQGGNVAFEGQTNEFWLIYFGLIVAAIVNSVMVITVVNEFVKIYIKDPAELSFDQVWVKVKDTFFNYFFSLIGYSISIALLVGFIALLLAGLGAAGGGFLVFIFALGLIFVVVATMILIYIAIIAKTTEDLGLFQSIQRGFYLLKGKWWSTFGIIIVMGLLSSLAGVIFSIPNTIIIGIDAFHGVTNDFSEVSATSQIVVIFTNIISSFGTTILSSIPIIAVIFQYYNLVERRDATGMMDEISAMGNKEEDSDEGEDY